jgi:hypothetical protein
MRTGVEASRITFDASRLQYPLPGGGSAIYNSSGLNYIRHTDWLGSSRLATTWSAHAVYAKEAYAPFGETYNEAGTADRSFTAQDQDVVTGRQVARSSSLKNRSEPHKLCPVHRVLCDERALR